jgi:hypothetical protein
MFALRSWIELSPTERKVPGKSAKLPQFHPLFPFLCKIKNQGNVFQDRDISCNFRWFSWCSPRENLPLKIDLGMAFKFCPVLAKNGKWANSPLFYFPDSWQTTNIVRFFPHLEFFFETANNSNKSYFFHKEYPSGWRLCLAKTSPLPCTWRHVARFYWMKQTRNLMDYSHLIKSLSCYSMKIKPS